MEKKYLRNLYYNPERPVSFGGVDSIYRAVKNDAKYHISGNKIYVRSCKYKTRILYINLSGIASNRVVL